MKKLLGIFSASIIWAFSFMPANSDVGFGVTALVGELDTSGTETEKTVTGVTSQKTSTSFEESFMGASVYAEFRTDNRFAFGVEYVPVDIEVGSGTRTDSNSDADVASEADTGDRSASADIEGLTTFYARVPIPNTSNAYIKLGYMDADVTTAETLPTSSYGDVSLNGIEYGLGFASDSGRSRVELSYSDFDDISITGTGSGETNQNSITADADALALRISFGF